MRRWRIIERGWYECDLGTICHEIDGWYLFPFASPRMGPFKTFNEAKMAVQYIVTQEEMMSLIEQLELTSLRARDAHAPKATIHKADIDDLHRTFHHVVVRWAQSIGFDGWRK
jgi:hypothetical protein